MASSHDIACSQMSNSQKLVPMGSTLKPCTKSRGRLHLFLVGTIPYRTNLQLPRLVPGMFSSDMKPGLAEVMTASSMGQPQKPNQTHVEYMIRDRIQPQNHLVRVKPR